MSALDELLNKHNTEPDVAVEPTGDQPATEPVDDTTKEVVSNTSNDGNATADKNPTEPTDKPTDSLPEDKKDGDDNNAKPTKVDKSKLTRQQKADFKCAKLTHENSVKNKQIEELTRQLADANEALKTYQENKDFEKYLEMREAIKSADAYKQQLEREVSEVPTEVREAQAEAIWDSEDEYEAKILEVYKTDILPKSNQTLADVTDYITKNYGVNVAKDVVDYIKSSDNNPILELALNVKGLNKEVVDSMCKSSDPRRIWLNCSNVENNLVSQLKSVKESNAKPANENPTANRCTKVTSSVSMKHTSNLDAMLKRH